MSTATAKRNTLLIGSMPFADETDAMTRAMDHLGDTLLCIPDGEIGEKTELYPNGKRAAWVMTAINLCSEDPANWKIVRDVERGPDGFPVDYQKVQRLRPRHAPAQMDQYLKFGYDDYFRQSYPIFQKLRQERGLNNLKFQVGVPTGLGITFSMMAPLDALRYATAFNKRIALEVNNILKIARDDVVIQIEVPGEVAMAYMLPGFLMGLATRGIFDLLNRIDAPAQIGFHLCLGDLNNIALTHAPSLDKMVQFSNRIVDHFPKQHRLLYMHYPLAEAAEPPPLEAAYYAPLKQIHLPPGTRFVAGFVHEKRTPAEQQQILQNIEQIRGEPVAVACSCGLGRRPASAASSLIQTMETLAVR